MKTKHAYPVISGEDQVFELGITKREYFAAKAMDIVVDRFKDFANEGEVPVQTIARQSFALADAMLEEGAKS